jgi:hypothetical protein
LKKAPPDLVTEPRPRLDVGPMPHQQRSDLLRRMTRYDLPGGLQMYSVAELREVIATIAAEAS